MKKILIAFVIGIIGAFLASAETKSYAEFRLDIESRYSWVNEVDIDWNYCYKQFNGDPDAFIEYFTLNPVDFDN